jgi:UDP-N-acetylmuramate-alanine ligase
MPSSIESIAQSLHNRFADKQIQLVFQPHQVIRVLEYRDAFVSSVQEFASVSIWSLYAAREQRQSYDHVFIDKETTLDDIGKRFARVCE